MYIYIYRARAQTASSVPGVEHHLDAAVELLVKDVVPVHALRQA